MTNAVGVDPGLRQRGSVADVVGSVALVVYSITASTAFAALVFNGPAADGLPRGVATFLLASGLITVIIGVRTTLPLAFGVVQDTAAIVLVPAVATVVASGSDDPVRDLFVILSLSSLGTGMAMWAIGRAGWGGAARFMPTTVVAGFLAGTGWLLVEGGIGIATGRQLGFGDLDELATGDLAKFWAPALALGTLVAVVPLLRRVSPLVSSVATIVSTAGFFAVVAVGSSLDAVEDGGWLLGPFPDGGSIDVVNDEVASADWSAISSASGQLAVVLVLSLLGAILNVGGIQKLLDAPADIDAELRSTGIANVAVAPIGGLVGYHGVGDSALADRLGVRARWAPIAVGVATALFALVGTSAVGYLPKFVAGGLLIGAGLGLIVDWVRQVIATAAWTERAVSVTILAVIVGVGILEGIGVGLAAACVFFVIRYSQIDPIRMVSTGRERRSVVERDPEQTAHLDQLADRLVVYELHGALFFGSASRIGSAIRSRLVAGPPPKVVIIDCSRVTDIDSSAFGEFAAVGRDLAAVDIDLIWSSVDRSTTGALERAIERPVVATDLDAALERAEETLLENGPCNVDRRPSSASARTDGSHDGNDDHDALSAGVLAWFVERDLAAGELVMAEGAPSDELVILEAGSASVTGTGGHGRIVRLRKVRTGAMVGEIGFLTGAPRTATVTADSDVRLRVLTADAHRRLRREAPELAIELYDHVLRGTADRAAAIHRSLTQALR